MPRAMQTKTSEMTRCPPCTSDSPDNSSPIANHSQIQWPKAPRLLGWHCYVTAVQHRTPCAAIFVLVKKGDPPGGTAGRVGARHGVDEVPWVQRVSTKRGIHAVRKKSVADVHGADVAAEGVVLAHQAGAIIRSRGRGGDRAADDGGAEQACTETPARWKPWASALVVVEAMLPATVRAATARAAILVLIVMGYSIRLRTVRCGPLVPIGRRLLRSGSFGACVNFW